MLQAPAAKYGTIQWQHLQVELSPIDIHLGLFEKDSQEL
jgi:hypothetical protein